MILSRRTEMENNYRARAVNILHIVLGAARPLTLLEVSIAVAVLDAISDNQRDWQLYIEDEQRFAETAREICGLFITIIDNKVYLLHQTAREFLVARTEPKAGGNLVGCKPLRDQRREWEWRYLFHPSESNSMLALACLRYLVDIDSSELDDAALETEEISVDG